MDSPEAVKGITPLTTPSPAGTAQRRPVSDQSRRRFANLLEPEQPNGRPYGRHRQDNNDPAAGPQHQSAEASATWFHAGALAGPSLLGAGGAPEQAVPGDLRQLLEDVCSSLHLAAERADCGHMLIGLGSALPGATVELRRDGAFLQVRLRATDPAVLALMRRQRDTLMTMLRQASSLDVDLEITPDEG